MARDIGPFPPGQAVSLKFFVGRSHEIKRILRAGGAATEWVPTFLGNWLDSPCGRWCYPRPTSQIVPHGRTGYWEKLIGGFCACRGRAEMEGTRSSPFLGEVTSLKEVVRRIFHRLAKESSTEAGFGRSRIIFAVGFPESVCPL